MSGQIINGLCISFRRLDGKKGQTLVEYALVLSLVSVLTIVFMSGLGVEIQGLYLPIINALDAARRSIE